ncbi:MAG: hypothetical protein ACR5KV_01475 [Wolbachia sp.]
MIRIGVTTKKDFFLITRRHFSFLFMEKYVKNRRKIMKKIRYVLFYIKENPFEVLEEYYRMCKMELVGPLG